MACALYPTAASRFPHDVPGARRNYPPRTATGRMPCAPTTNRGTARARSWLVPARSIIVSIFGPSNAGKSQLAKAVAVAVGEHRCARIPTDYFQNLPDEPDPNSPGALTY